MQGSLQEAPNVFGYQPAEGKSVVRDTNMTGLSNSGVVSPLAVLISMFVLVCIVLAPSAVRAVPSAQERCAVSSPEADSPLSPGSKTAKSVLPDLPASPSCKPGTGTVQ